MTSRLAGFVESMGAGVWVLDPQYRTEYVNPCMARMLGCVPEEMAGASLLDFISEDAHTAAHYGVLAEIAEDQIFVIDREDR